MSKVKKWIFLIVNFPLFIGRHVAWWSKKEWLLHFSGYYFQTKSACLICLVKQKNILPSLRSLFQIYKKPMYTDVNFPFLIWNILDPITA